MSILYYQQHPHKQTEIPSIQPIMNELKEGLQLEAINCASAKCLLAVWIWWRCIVKQREARPFSSWMLTFIYIFILQQPQGIATNPQSNLLSKYEYKCINSLDSTNTISFHCPFFLVFCCCILFVFIFILILPRVRNYLSARHPALSLSCVVSRQAEWMVNLVVLITSVLFRLWKATIILPNGNHLRNYARANGEFKFVLNTTSSMLLPPTTRKIQQKTGIPLAQLFSCHRSR